MTCLYFGLLLRCAHSSVLDVASDLKGHGAGVGAPRRIYHALETDEGPDIPAHGVVCYVSLYYYHASGSECTPCARTLPLSC